MPVFLWIVLLAVLVSCATVPHTGRRQFNLVSDAQINALALKAFNKIVEEHDMIQDDRLTRILNRTVSRISGAAEKIDAPGFEWEARLVNKDVPNAFCLPGGKIIVYSGLVPYVVNEAGLAAVIGHEVAHAVARHGAERMSQKLALQGAVILGGEIMRDKGGRLSDKARLALGALGMGATVGILLPYSRVHEHEADEIGMIYMAAAGYDPREAIRVWERMSKIKKPPIPVWLSTHPADADRIRTMKEFLPQAMKVYQEAPQKYGRGSLL